MKVRQLSIRNFRGWASAVLYPADHVVLVGEPGAGRTDTIEALTRVLHPDSTRAGGPDEFDFHRRNLGVRIEIEAVLGDLADDLQQAFFDHLELWDCETRRVVPELASPDLLQPSHEWVVRLCYRAEWSAATETGRHWVDYPKTTDPGADDPDYVRRVERELLPFVRMRASGRPLDLGARGAFRGLVDDAEGDDFAGTLNALLAELASSAERFSSSGQVGEALKRVLAPVRTHLARGGDPDSVAVSFRLQGGSLSDIVRELEPAYAVPGETEILPVGRHGSTAGAAIRVALALAAIQNSGAIVAVDDFGEDIDAATAEHLAAVVAAGAGQAWISTRRAAVAAPFEVEHLVRLTAPAGSTRTAHVGQAPADRDQRTAMRHLALQLLPAASSRAVAILEGPHDRAAYLTLARRRWRDGGVRLPAASSISIIDAGAADSSGGVTAIPRLARLARALGFRVITVIDGDPADQASAEIQSNLAAADAVVLLPRGCAVEKALLAGLDDATIRDVIHRLKGVHGVRPQIDVRGLSGSALVTEACTSMKQPSLHAQFVDALPQGVLPETAVKVLDAITEAARGRGGLIPV